MSGSGGYRRDAAGGLRHQRRKADIPGAMRAMGTCPDCGKVRFATRRDAAAAIRQQVARRGKLRPQRCGEYWHVTSQATAEVTRHRERP